MTKSLWVRQTAYTVIVVAVVAMAITGTEIVSSYYDERARLHDFGNQLIDSVYDSAARAAFHVDRLQAEAVIEGLMNFEELQYVSISTDLDAVLARRTGLLDESAEDTLAVWLFSDIARFQRTLTIDRSEFISGQQRVDSGGVVSVGSIEVWADPAVVGHSFASNIRARIIDLAIEFLVLGTALAYIFYLTTTKPLVNVAEQLGKIDPHGLELDRLEQLKSHRNDELGLVVDRINELLRRIDEQQADLIHREKVAALGSMLAEVAHELNNPLAVVTAQAELLAETATDEKTRERADKILRPAKRCANIVRKFLSLARQRKIEKSVLDVRRLIGDSVEMLNYQFAKRNIRIKTEIDPDVARIWGDGAQLGQVLINILINAQQSLIGTDGDKEISVIARLGNGGESVIISVTDTGPGIPGDIRHKIFDHFFTTKPEGRGTGLGLAFCKSVVETHGGTIVMKDVRPHGAEFVIDLPNTTRADVNVIGRAHPDQSLSALRVLVVDDEEPLATSIAEVLTRYGHTATTAFSSEQAMARLDGMEFDVILADVHMPGEDGMDFYRRVLAMDKTMAERFVFVTGDALDPRVIEFFEEQRRPYINKPFELRELIAVVEQVLLAPKTLQTPNVNPEARFSA
jgi:signal transduction histidine kinase/ActR/RegA family two-component response regulator